MKNAALYTSGTIFFLGAIAQFLRFKSDIAVLVDNKYQIPVESSLYASIVLLILGLWMFIAARKNH